MSCSMHTVNPPERTLMGPGPSDVSARVLSALGRPTIGHLDPVFIKLMDDTRELLQKIFHTQNQLTIPVSATGSAGMEACMVNVIEPGDRILICQNGVFGGRMADIGRRLGAEVILVEAPWGEAIDPDKIKAALDGKPTKLLGIVHAETSTGVRQPHIKECAKLIHDVGGLLLLDCVTSLGGVEVKIDDWEVDLAYSGTQKCLSCPPGLAPITLSAKAVDIIKARKVPCVSWYLDLSMIMNYWGGERAYHHTAPINMIYALRESLLEYFDQGEEAVHKRHLDNHLMLEKGVRELGLEMPIAKDIRLPQLNVVQIPQGVDDAQTRKRLLNEYNLEIGGGLGNFKGKVWRVGLMGHGATKRNVAIFLSALKDVLGR